MSNAVPQGWSELSLKEVSTVITKGTTPTTYGAGYAQSGVKFIRVENISKSGFIDESELRFISKETHETLKRSQLQSGDLLVSIAGAIGRSAIVSDKNLPANTNQAVGIVRLIKEEIIADFARYSIESPVVAQQMSDSQAGNAQVNLNLEQLGGLRFYRPPLPEQQKIATILSSVDDVIEKTRAQIDKLKDLKTGMMQELLTKGIGHTEFKDSPVGRIPASWTVGLFEDLCVLQRGFDLPVQDRLKGDVPILGSNGIVGRHNEAKVLSPAVITGRSGSLGDVLFVLEDCWPLNTSLYIKDFKGNDEKFVFYFLQHFNLKKYGTGTGVPTLNRNDVHIVNVSFPCLVEQIKIAEALTVIDETIAKKACSIESKKSLKKALMQDLLTGKVRVNLTDKESAVV